MLENEQLIFGNVFYLFLIVCCQEMESRNFFFSFLSLLVIFDLHFVLSPLFCCLWIRFPDGTRFVTAKCWAVNLLLHYFHPIQHLIYSLMCNPKLQCAPDLALHMAKALGRASATTSASSFMCKAQVSHCPEKWTWEIHFSLQHAELGGVSYKGTQVRCEGREYSSSGYSLTLLCDFISKRKRKGNKKKLFTKVPSLYLPLTESC